MEKQNQRTRDILFYEYYHYKDNFIFFQSQEISVMIFCGTEQVGAYSIPKGEKRTTLYKKIFALFRFDKKERNKIIKEINNLPCGFSIFIQDKKVLCYHGMTGNAYYFKYSGGKAYIRNLKV